MHPKYPNTDAAGWRDIKPEDATPEELDLVYQISGPRPDYICREQWRANMRACARSIRAHRAEVAQADPDKRRLDWLQENNARLQFDAEDAASLPYAVVYLPSLKDGWREAGRGDDFREAIDVAMKSDEAEAQDASARNEEGHRQTC